MSESYYIRPYDDPLPKPWKSYFTLQNFCIFIGMLFLFEESFQIGQKINHLQSSLHVEDEEADFMSYRDLPIVLSLRIPALIAAVFLLFGARKAKSTLIAVFLWVTLEVHILYFIYILYKNIKKLPQENLEVVIPIIVIKAILWWVVNMHHNDLKLRELQQKIKPIRLETAV
uniref:CSON001469 protein n=1 Tax=Culicoides sonorensis TaxID=179676 RepID=A0A336L087_CULSO